MKRRLSLVGESLPDGVVVQVGNLKSLEPLDARHGVYPNLVMTPLLSALWAMRQQNDNTDEFWKQIESLLDTTANRFNVFKKSDSGKKDDPAFEILPDTKRRVTGFDASSELWALFGYQTVFGLIRWVLTGEDKTTKSKIKSFAKEFLAAAGMTTDQSVVHSNAVPKNRSAKEGIVHRLCTHADQEHRLRQAVQSNTKFLTDAERHLQLFRCFIPLLHNEAYQMVPYGLGQANFSLAKDYDHRGAEHAGELYWKVMGKAIAFRLQDRFVE
jgi:hypothetical protein